MTRQLAIYVAAAIFYPLGEHAAAETAALEEVLVTARHREENLQQTPLTVSVFSDEDSLVRGMQTIGDLQRYVPNTSIHPARGSSSTLTAYIRGIGQDDPLWGYEPGVGLYIDDVYIARPQGALLDIYDIERVEILRGPQGTLYGKNTLGGAIKYVTRNLPADDTHVEVQATLGDYQRRDATISASTPITDTLIGGAAIASYYRDGFGTNISSGRPVSDKDVLATRLSADWSATQSWKLAWSADMTIDNSNARGAQRLTDSVLTGEPPLDNPHDVRSNLSDTNYVKTKGTAATLTGALRDDLHLRAISAYREGETRTNIDFDTLAVSSFDVPAWYSDDQLSQEFRLNHDGDKWSTVAGIYYLDGDACGSFDLIVGLTNTVQTISGCVNTKSAAAFGHVSYEVTDALRISFGVRHTRDEKRARVYQAVNVSNVSTDFTNDDSWAYTSPRVGVDYQLKPDLLLFMSLSDGFKSGGFNMRANALREMQIGRDASQPFDEETLKTVEIGMKGQWLAKRITANTTAFFSNYRDIQITTSRFYDSDNDMVPDRSFTQVDNAGEADLSGVEIEISAAALDRWTINTNIGYLNTELKRFTEYSSLTGQSVDNAANRALIDTPRWTASLENIVDVYRDVNGGLAVHVHLHHRSDYYPEILNSELIRQPSYNLWDLALVHHRNDLPLTVALNVLNATDEEYRIAGYNYPLAGGGESVVTGFYGDPRTLSVTVRYEWR